LKYYVKFILVWSEFGSAAIKPQPIHGFKTLQYMLHCHPDIQSYSESH